MFWNLLTKFLFFFLLLTCSSVCAQASSKADSKKAQNSFALFDQTVEFAERSGAKKYQSFTTPSLSYIGGVLSVFAKAKNNTDLKCDNGAIVEGYAVIKNDNEHSFKLDGVFNSQSGKAKWKIQIAATNNAKNCTGSPTAVVNKDKIYLFFKNVSDTTDTGVEWEYTINSGKVNGGNTDKKISWEPPAAVVPQQQTTSIKNSNNLNSIESGGSGNVVDNTVVVPVMYTKQGSSDDYLVSIITNSTDIENKKWKLVLGKSPVKGMSPAIVEWNKKLIMMATNKDGSKKMYESSNMGGKWKGIFLPFSAMWGNTKETTADGYVGKNGFITADLGKKGDKVLLVTQPVAEGSTYNLRLWMTAYQRMYDAGAIAAGVQKNTSSTLLFAEKNLFAAYETWNEGNATIHAVHLVTELDDLNKVLEKWTTQDEFLSKSCFYDNLTLTQNDDCTSKIPINGLVGFLSDNYKNNNWSDEYAGVDAIVKEGTNVSKSDKGLRFNGAGAGATWPIGETEQNQRYYLANNGFALVATVKIDSDTSKKKNSILGVGLVGSDGNKKSIGLWCDNGKWSVSNGKNINEGKVTEKACVKEGIYHVALILNQNTFSLYIGKDKIKEMPRNTIDAKQPLNITHFYFGADNEGQESQSTDSYVTVTNVFLYNWPFADREIKNLKEYVTIKKDTKPPNGNTTPQESQEIPTPLPSNTDENEKKTEDETPSPSRTEDGSVGGGVRVFTLLLAVLCVSAPLLHL